MLTNVWVRQLYLEYYKDGENDDQVHVFDWGFRSKCEINKKALLTFVSQVYDASVCIETWHEQFEAANHRFDDESD